MVSIVLSRDPNTNHVTLYAGSFVGDLDLEDWVLNCKVLGDDSLKQMQLNVEGNDRFITQYSQAFKRICFQMSAIG